MLVLVRAEYQEDQHLPEKTLDDYPGLMFRDVADISSEAIVMSRCSALDHALAFPSCYSVQGVHVRVRRNRMIHGHDVLVRRALWEVERVRPAVDVVGYRRMEKKTRSDWGDSRIGWIKDVVENVRTLEEEVLKRYGMQYHHADLFNLFNKQMLETVALAAVTAKRRPKLPYICVRQALGPPFTERQQKAIASCYMGCRALSETCVEACRGMRLLVDGKWKSLMKDAVREEDCFAMLKCWKEKEGKVDDKSEIESLVTTTSSDVGVVEEDDDDILGS